MVVFVYESCLHIYIHVLVRMYLTHACTVNTQKFISSYYIASFEFSFTYVVPETSIHNLTVTAFNSTSVSLSWHIRHVRRLNGPSQLFLIMFYPTGEGELSTKGANTSDMVSLKDFAAVCAI